MRTKKNENVYQDSHSGGWIAEVRALRGSDHEWDRVGTFGSHDAAMAAVVRLRAEECPEHCPNRDESSCSSDHGWDAPPAKLSPRQSEAIQNHRSMWRG